MRDQTDLRWCGLALHLGRQTQSQLIVEPDPRWPGMWRIRDRDGQLSDIVNLSRARDAAEIIALAEFNGCQGGNGRAEAPPVRFPSGPASDIGRHLDKATSRQGLH